MDTGSHGTDDASCRNDVITTCTACGHPFKTPHPPSGGIQACGSCGFSMDMNEVEQESFDLEDPSSRATVIVSWLGSIIIHAILLASLGGVTLWSGLETGGHAREVEIFMEDDITIRTKDITLETVPVPLPSVPLSAPQDTVTETSLEELASTDPYAGIEELLDQEFTTGRVKTASPDGLDVFLAHSGGEGASAVFFGAKATGQRIVYVVDASSSMAGKRLAAAQWELIRSIFALDSHMMFFVLFYGEELIVREGQKTFVPATMENKGRTMEWIEHIQADTSKETPQAKKNLEMTFDPESETIQLLQRQDDEGDNTQEQTYAGAALARAYGLKPDAIYLLSDGHFSDRDRVWQLVQNNHRRLGIPIHTIGFYVHTAELAVIAEMTGGRYKPWRRGEE